jgi:histidinol phosphatase-like PHP family hydrolase
VRIDLHVHTVRGSDCSVLAPDELVERAARVGLDGVCITEHDHIWHSSELEESARRHGVMLFFGMEVNTEHGEVLAFGPEEYKQGFHKLSKLRRTVDEHKGVIIAAHPFRAVFSPFYAKAQADRPTMEQAAQWPMMKLVDALEIVNGASTKEEAEFAESVATHLGLGMAGGSDAHSVDGLGMCATEFERDISCWSELLGELRAGRYRPVDLRDSTPPPS